MGGTLTAASDGRNRGTTISFAIPLLQQEGAPPGPSATATEHAPSLSSAAPTAENSVTGGASLALLQLPFPARDSAAPRVPLRVLVAEDDPLCAAVMRKMLERIGGIAGTMIVGDGVAAVAAYERGAFVVLQYLVSEMCALADMQRCGCALAAAEPPFHVILLDVHSASPPRCVCVPHHSLLT
jgi:hypothetical protein